METHKQSVDLKYFAFMHALSGSSVQYQQQDLEAKVASLFLFDQLV